MAILDRGMLVTISDVYPHTDRLQPGRREFLKLCAMAAAAVGLPASAGRAFAESAMAGAKPSVIWLHFSECTGCTET
ncbi:MAG TPA: twin-arginine translocation signal domain-containing protein, partial [Longimicrobiales bacterium]|nr:twin-arginine translocation signal domain-containing protein [Longimicrobiales bacterium]